MFDKNLIERLKKESEEWESSELEPYVMRHPERKPEFKVSSGNLIKRLYSPLDLDGMDYWGIGLPGKYPFTRGINPTMYRSNLWVMGLYSGYGTAEESNKRYKYLLKQGSTGIGIAFDLPTQMGLDSDHSLSLHQVGIAGVAIDTLEDMRVLLDGIPIEDIEVRAIANSQAVVILAMIVAIAQERNIDLKKVRLEIMNDILKEYTVRGNYIFPPNDALRLFADIVEYGLKEIPNCVSSKICGYHMREAGCTAVQEVAFTMANAIAYMEQALKRGLDVNQVGTKFRFYFGCHRNVIEEVAKLRAARRLWARLVKERFKASSPEAMKLRLFVTSSGSTLSSVEPYNNIIRIAFQALIGVLGGAEVMHLASMDEGHALPTEQSAKIALRTQQIIAYETGVTDSVDPLGGSYMVEYLTTVIEEEAVEYIRRIDEMGGVVAAIESGYIQKEIAGAAYLAKKEEDAGEKVVVGVNKFRTVDKEKINVLKIDPAVEAKQIDKLNQVRKRRDPSRLECSLRCVEKAASTGGNMVYPIIDAVKEYASIGEICDVLRRAFGVYRAQSIL
jgi:methylmalonyl-CoA mutase N-terminal domain/subunit